MYQKYFSHIHSCQAFSEVQSVILQSSLKYAKRSAERSSIEENKSSAFARRIMYVGFITNLIRSFMYKYSYMRSIIIFTANARGLGSPCFLPLYLVVSFV